MSNQKLNQIGDILSHPKIGPGEWLVVSTTMTGGGTGHGPHDVYPDRHKLTLRRVKKGTDQVISWSADAARHFYQSGCFREDVMLDYVKPLRRAS